MKENLDAYRKSQMRKGVMSIFCGGLLIGVCVGLRSTALIFGGLAFGGAIVGLAWYQVAQAFQSTITGRVTASERG